MLLAGLEITLIARSIGISATIEQRGKPEDFVDPYNISEALKNQCIQATSPEELARLIFLFLF